MIEPAARSLHEQAEKLGESLRGPIAQFASGVERLPAALASFREGADAIGRVGDDLEAIGSASESLSRASTSLSRIEVVLSQWPSTDPRLEEIQRGLDRTGTAIESLAGSWSAAYERSSRATQEQLAHSLTNLKDALELLNVSMEQGNALYRSIVKKLFDERAETGAASRRFDPRGLSSASSEQSDGRHGDASVAARRGFGRRIWQLGRRFVRRGRRHQADRGPAVHPASDDGDHGAVAQGGRPGGAEEHRRRNPASQKGRGPLKISTPPRLPEAIAGPAVPRGARGDRRQRAAGMVGRGGTARLAQPGSRVRPDRRYAARARPRSRSNSRSGSVTAATPTRSRFELVVLPYQSESVRVWKRLVNGVPWRAWLEQGVGFLVLWLVHLVGMNLLANAERGSLAETAGFENSESEQHVVRKRFASYRLIVRLVSLTAMLALLGWLLAAPMLARHVRRDDRGLDRDRGAWMLVWRAGRHVRILL